MANLETRLVLKRHCPTTYNEGHQLARIQGRKIDDPLSPTGLGRAKELSRQLQHDTRQFSAIVSSPMKRALETADIYGEAIGVKTEINNGLTNRDFGLLTGKTYEETAKDRSDESIFGKNDLGVEMDRDMEARIFGALKTIAQAHLGWNILIITHSEVIKFILNFLGIIRYTEFPLTESFKVDDEVELIYDQAKRIFQVSDDAKNRLRKTYCKT